MVGGKDRRLDIFDLGAGLALSLTSSEGIRLATQTSSPVA